MTNHTEERILLAEAAKLYDRLPKNWRTKGGWPAFRKYIEQIKDQKTRDDLRSNFQKWLPNSRNNPADTEAVMDWLDKTCDLFRLYREEGGITRATIICHYNDALIECERKKPNWKHAVTEVAVKVAREMKDETLVTPANG